MPWDPDNGYCCDCGTTTGVSCATDGDTDPLCSNCRDKRAERDLEGALFNYEAKREDWNT